MAYNNTFFYNRDNSVDDKYNYIYDFSINFDPIFYLQTYADIRGNDYFSKNPFEHYKNFGIREGRLGSARPANLYLPIYGTSINYSSRLNFLQTIDNSLKALPASENNLTVSYNLKFLLDDNSVGHLLKTIEIAGGTKYLIFADPSNLYSQFTGFVERYSVNKTSANLSEVNITLNYYAAATEFSWRSSVFYKKVSAYEGGGKMLTPITYDSYSTYSKHSVVYYSIYESRMSGGVLLNGNITANSPPRVKNKIDNFWFAKQDVQGFYAGADHTGYGFIGNINEQVWTKNFYFESKYPFVLENEIDIYKIDYKNSFIQNVKYKENSNVLKQFSLKFENITTAECRAILFFLEKKCGYKRFVYEFPVFMKKNKVFICNQWSHVFKYDECHDLTLQLIEDPNPNLYITPNGGYYLI